MSQLHYSFDFTPAEGGDAEPVRVNYTLDTGGGQPVPLVGFVVSPGTAREYRMPDVPVDVFALAAIAFHATQLKMRESPDVNDDSGVGPVENPPEVGHAADRGTGGPA